MANIINDPAFKKKLEQMTPQVPPLSGEVEFPTLKPLSGEATFPGLNEIANRTAAEVATPPPAFDTLSAQPLNIASATPRPVQVESAPMEGAPQFNVPDPVLGNGQITNAAELSNFMGGLNQQAGLPPILLGQTTGGTVDIEPQAPQGGGTITKGGVTTTFSPQAPQTGGTITKGGETFTTQGFGQQISNVTGQAPAGQSPAMNIPTMQQGEARIAQRVAGLTPEQRAQEIAMSDAAANRAQIRGEEARGLFRPSQAQIGQAQQEAVARQADYEQRQVNRRIDASMDEFMDQNPTATPQQVTEHLKVVSARESLVDKQQQPAETQAEIPKPSATQQKISLIREANPNISDADASAIASGSVKVVQNPLTGETQLLNVATGEARKVVSPQVSEEFDIAAPKNTLFSRAGQFTGAVEAAKRKAQGITGQAGLDVATDESLEAAQDFETAQNALVRAFRESDRYAATEANQLKKELNISLSPFEDPKSAEAKLRSIDKSLERRYKNELATSKDTSSLPKKRQDARNRARAIAIFRAELGVPTEDTTQGADGGSSIEDIANKYLQK